MPVGNSGSKIAHCVCQSKQQDILYGAGIRLHNVCNHPTSKKPMEGLRCTVCGKVK